LKKDGEEEIEMANAITVMVCYDYVLKKSIAIPGRWRKWLGE
jgi:acyl-CoA thioesterase FadM